MISDQHNHTVNAINEKTSKFTKFTICNAVMLGLSSSNVSMSFSGLLCFYPLCRVESTVSCHKSFLRWKPFNTQSFNSPIIIGISFSASRIVGTMRGCTWSATVFGEYCMSSGIYSSRLPGPKTLQQNIAFGQDDQFYLCHLSILFIIWLIG